ncbi:MAG: hypothetical protein GXY92_00050 [Syntrophomonadaceae bacterium]|mgnify:CR=1 FL=1|nr:hypothetical protein [Syntrophomonadaceae bacterium]
MSSIELVSLRGFPKAFEDSLLRSGLLNRIENSAAGSVLICSMAGYGKSTLLSQLAARAERAAVCILDQNDNDPLYFLSHLSQAIRQAAPHLETVDTKDPYTVLPRICQITP